MPLDQSIQHLNMYEERYYSIHWISIKYSVQPIV